MLAQYDRLSSCFLVLLVCGAVAVQSASKTWGYVNKYASPIYDTEIKVVKWNSNEPWVEITYPMEGDTNNYTITAMHAFDVLGLEEANQVALLEGGVGKNNVKIRFLPSLRYGVHYRVTIYGLVL